MSSPAITYDDWNEADLRMLLIEPEDFSWSSAVDEPRSRAFELLYEAFFEAQEENWDGEGAESADAASYAHAQAFLHLLPSWVKNPEIYFDPDGEVCLEWDSGRRSVFSISIGRDGMLTYAGLFGAAKQHGFEPFVDDIPEILLANISRAVDRHS
jgi:hypothetical protein